MRGRCQWRQIAVKLECAFAESSLQSGEELTAEDATEHPVGKKERRAGRDPAGVVRDESSGGKDAVNVRMKLQALIPGVEHAEESDLRPQVAGIASDLEQGFGAGVEEQVVNQTLVLQGQRSKLAWQGEDNMHVAGGQQLLLTSLEPASPGVALTSRAMPVSARVVGDGDGMSTVDTTIAVSA